MSSSQSDNMSTPKKTRLSTSVDDDDSYVSSISRSLKKKLLEKDAAAAVIQTEKDAAIETLQLEFSEIKRKLLEIAEPDLNRHLIVKKVPIVCQETTIKQMFSPCGVILSCRMVVDFHFRTFIIIFNERESVTTAINNHKADPYTYNGSKLGLQIREALNDPGFTNQHVDGVTGHRSDRPVVTVSGGGPDVRRSGTFEATASRQMYVSPDGVLPRKMEERGGAGNPAKARK